MAADVFVDSAGLYALADHRDPARPEARRVVSELAGTNRRLVLTDYILDEAATLGRQLAKQPTAALAAIKQALLASSTNTLDEQLDLERDEQQRLGRTADYREGVDAFLSRRPPAFTGH